MPSFGELRIQARDDFRGGVPDRRKFAVRLKVSRRCPTQVDPGSPADRALQPLQDDRILYGNQPIAIAVAETLEAAFDAADRVAVRYAPENPTVTLDAGLNPGFSSGHSIAPPHRASWTGE